MCGSRENPYPPHLKDGHWKFRGEGVSVAKILKRRYEAKVEIPGKWEGSNQKTILALVETYFLEPHNK